MRHPFLPFPLADVKQQGGANENSQKQPGGSRTGTAIQDGCSSAEELVTGACSMIGIELTEPESHGSHQLWTETNKAPVEFQAIGEGDVDEQCGSAWETCTKYPDHHGFIPLPELSLHHLPQRFQSEDTLNYIRVRADLTVRLRIKVSSGRPPSDQFAKHAGFTGTAWIGDVAHFDKKCFCRGCKTKDTPRENYWYFLMHSATHCLYDEVEANNVRIDFFYDSQESMRDRTMKTLRGVRMLGAFRTEDICMMECATHDEDLGRYLRQKFEESSHLERKFSSNPLPHSLSDIPQNKVMVCVSHPHGKSKHVTVGDLKDQYEVKYQEPGMSLMMSIDRVKSGIHYRLSDYETRTCPGSSGAAVICLDKMMSRDVKDWLMLFCTHLSANSSKGLNTGLDISIESLNDYLEDRINRRITSVDDVRMSMQKTWVD